MTNLIVPSASSSVHRFDEPSSFSAWRNRVVESGILPIIGVAGSRGKTTVLRLLNAMLIEAGLETAIKTDISVDIRGKRQRGEIEPWSRSLDELALGTLDIALEEIDWHTVHAMGLEREHFPVVVVTNICGNREACQIQGEARIAAAALPDVLAATHRHGVLVINGDDMDIAREQSGHDPATILVGLNRDSPGLRGHLAGGGVCAWLDGGILMAGTDTQAVEIGLMSEIPFSLFGASGFQLQNALTAVSAAIAIGLDHKAIERALQTFSTLNSAMPDAFQAIDVDGVIAVVDRPNPSWFLRSVLRSLRGFAPSRVITVAGPMPSVPENDLREVGRLLGRISSLFVTHANVQDIARIGALKTGAAMNQVPPVFVQTKVEGRALNRAMSVAKRGELVLVLSERPAQVSRTLRRSAAFHRSSDQPAAV